MNLDIPKDQAIKILRERLQELNGYTFDPKAWKARAVLDLKEIFGVLGDPWLQVSHIQFDTHVTADKAKVLQEGRETAVKQLTSYIQFIEDYSAAAVKSLQIKDDTYKAKYADLLGQWNQLVPEYNDLIKKYQEELDDKEKTLEDLEEAKAENQRLLDNTIQLDNVSLKRLWMGIQNLPTKQFLGLISIVLAIFIGCFTIGKFVEQLGSKNELYDLKTENSKLKTENQALQTQIQLKSKGH